MTDHPAMALKYIADGLAPPPWRFVLTGDERGKVVANGPYGRIVLAEDVDQDDGMAIAAVPQMVAAIRAMLIARETPMVDDDFPAMLHRADSLMTAAVRALTGEDR